MTAFRWNYNLCLALLRCFQASPQRSVTNSKETHVHNIISTPLGQFATKGPKSRVLFVGVSRLVVRVWLSMASKRKVALHVPFGLLICVSSGPNLYRVFYSPAYVSFVHLLFLFANTLERPITECTRVRRTVFLLRECTVSLTSSGRGSPPFFVRQTHATIYHISMFVYLAGVSYSQSLRLRY
jgi:hypothetical protein